MSVRLYGRDVGNGSLAVVTRGFRGVLQQAGLLKGFVALDRSGGSEEEEAQPGALARDGIFTGNLNLIRAMQRGAKHERHWVTVTPNSTYLPRDLLAQVVSLLDPHILSASPWGTDIIEGALREMGCPEVPILTVRHGVSGFAPVREEQEKTAADFAKGEFRVVHFSTTAGERKGTLELVQAWASLGNSLGDGAKLFLVLDHVARSALLERLSNIGLAVPPNTNLLPRGDMSPEIMSRLLCHMHLVVCPSRGEGFGLGPLEARACGVPVVTTDVTGHGAGHCAGPGVKIIPYGYESAPIDDGPGAWAPVVRPQSIAEALQKAHRDWDALSGSARFHAKHVAETWSWQEQLAPLVRELQR